jgi:hypothetical protein
MNSDIISCRKELNQIKMTNWQSIETAPQDGTEILLAVNYPRALSSRFFTQVMTAQFSKRDQGWVATSGADVSGTATHWMPLPEAPPAERTPI